MLKAKDLNKSQFECAKMIGITKSQYNELCKKSIATKSTKSSKSSKKEYSKDFLSKLGISESMLKVRKDF